MDAFNTCSNCGSGLQAFYVKSADQRQLLEVDGCRKCKGLWFDAGELETTIGQKLKLKWVEGNTIRKCARCRQPMRPWKTEAGTTLEQCDTCRGVFLDAGELTALGSEHAESDARAALKPTVEFQCLKCQGHFPMSKGNAMGMGLVCPTCAPKPGAELIDRFVPNVSFDGDSSGSTSRLGGVSTGNSAWNLLDILDIFF